MGNTNDANIGLCLSDRVSERKFAGHCSIARSWVRIPFKPDYFSGGLNTHYEDHKFHSNLFTVAH